MPLIQPTVLLGIADRAAQQYKLLLDAFSVINQTGGGLYYERVNATADVDVQIPLLQPYYTVDQGFVVNRWVQLAGNLPLVVSGMDNHFNKMGSVGSWDGYLSTHDCRVSDYFNQIHKLSKSMPLLAVNVFCEVETNFGMAAVSAGPAIDFIDGDDFGPGMNPHLRADGGNFAAAQLKVVAIGNIGASDLDLTITVKNWLGDIVTMDVTVPAGSLAGAEFQLGTSTDRFMDVTGIGFKSGGSTGTVGDAVRIFNIKERAIAL
jgi:hypothetical protein